MPRPRSLTQAGIAAAALAVIDSDRLAALSMRAVAARLGVATMSLYRYVTDRKQLEGLVVDLVVSGVDLSPPGGSWQRKVTVLVERVRDAVGAHPEVVPLIVVYRHASDGVLSWAEAVLGVLTSAGFAGRLRVVALRSLLRYLIGSIQLEHLGLLSAAGTTMMADLSADQYPLLVETARQAQHISVAEEFHDGLAVLLHGLQTELSRQ